MGNKLSGIDSKSLLGTNLKMDEMNYKSARMSRFGNNSGRGGSPCSSPRDYRQTFHSLFKFDNKIDINEQFKFLATIGKGAYGSVLLVESVNIPDEIFAIKVLKYMEHYKTNLEKEEHVKNLTQEL